MNYLESKPAPALAAYVKCFWALEYERSGLGDEPEPVIPDGCVEIVYNLSARFRQYADDGSFKTQPQALVAGQMDRRVVIGPSGNVRLFGIRFWPAGAFPFFDFSMSELSGRIEPLDAVWGNAAGELGEMLWNAGTFANQAAVAEKFLQKVFRANDRHGPWLRASIDAINASSGTLRIAKLARAVGKSERGLERSFNQSIGISPKAFSRVVRFQSVLRSLELTPDPRMSSIALDLGYFDQSHLIGDFHRFTGMTPVEYLTANNRITDIFLPE